MVGLTHYAWLGLVVSCDGRRGRSGDHRVMKCFVGFFVAERHQSRLPSVMSSRKRC